MRRYGANCYAVLRAARPGYVTAARRQRALMLQRLETAHPHLGVNTLATHFKICIRRGKHSVTFRAPSVSDVVYTVRCLSAT